MGFLKAIGGFLKGDFVKNAMDFVNKRWPPNMSESDKAQMKLVIKDMLHGQKVELLALGQEDERIFNQRMVDMEGTAKDLKTIPFIGPLIIFLRGAFRPLFSYMVGYFDFVFFTTDTGQWPEQKVTLLIIINILVIGFYFGERMMKNVMPLITNMLAARAPAVKAE